MIKFPLITSITESNLQHAPVAERFGGQRKDNHEGRDNLVTEAAGGWSWRAQVKSENELPG